MNLSGNAVRYWAEREKIPVDHILVLVDDVALPFGAIRMKSYCCSRTWRSVCLPDRMS